MSVEGGGGPSAGSATFASLDPLVRPRSVAVVGASDDPTRIGGRPIAFMKAQGVHGPGWPAKPRPGRVQGLPALAPVSALPEAPDAAIVAVPVEAALDAVEELGRKGCKAVIAFTAGFAEVDEAGARAQAALGDRGRAHGMRLLGPNCLGLFNAGLGYFPIFSSSFENGWPLPGRIGIASQSGAFGTHLFAVARDRGLGTPVLVTTGNEAEVALGDVIGWMARAPEIDVIAAYAEGIRESGRFLAALDLARRNRKPVVMMKVGRSALGAHAAKSHTASIAGDDAVTQAVLEEFGVHRARTTEELLDVAYAATRRVYPTGNTLGVVTISGGAGVLISDAAEAVGLPMPPMPEEAQARLKALVPFSPPRNPVDCTAQAFNDMGLIGKFASSMVEDGGYRSVLAFFTQLGASPSVAPALRAQLKAVMDRHPDRLWVLSIVAPVELPLVTLPSAAPSEAAAKRLLAEAGVPAVPEHACADPVAAVAAADRIGYPVVLKILSPDILHKSEIGGVLLGVQDADAVREGFATLLERARQHAPEARLEGVLVAKQIAGAVEMALGIARDPVFGPVAMVGLGGIFIEILKDVAFRRCPFDAAEAERMVRSLKGAPLLLGARGRPKADVAALAQALSRLSAFAAAAGTRLASVDVNPMLVLPEGQGCYAADAVIEVADA